MSEERNLTDGPTTDPGGSEPTHAEIEALLCSLVPRQPSIHRDLLFFEAGKAATGRGTLPVRLTRIAWPAVAATLLVAASLLAVELQQKSVALSAALAALERSPAGADVPSRGLAQEEQGAVMPRTDDGRPNPPPALSDRRRFGWRQASRSIEEMSLLDSSRGCQLTAKGWVKNRCGGAAAEDEAAPLDPDHAAPARYIDLMRTLGG